MAINRINETDLQGKLVSQLSNRPTDPRSAGGDNMTAQEVKARHDALGLLVKDKLNELLDALNNATVNGEPVTPLSDLITVVADGVSKSLTEWIEAKLTKSTSAGEGVHAYGVDDDGEQTMLPVSDAATEGAIPQYGTGGVLPVANGTDDGHAMNKGQVDAIVETLTAAIAAKYTKPDGGIPLTDLASSVSAIIRDALLWSNADASATPFKVPIRDGTGVVHGATYGASAVGTALVNKEQFEPVKALAEGANKAFSVASYSALATALNAAASTAYKVGQSIYVATEDVPDVWVYSVDDSSVSYTYTTDYAFEAALVAGTLQIGYYTLRPLETEKVDLTGYATETYVGNAISGNIDATLDTTGKSADAKAVGDAIDALIDALVDGVIAVAEASYAESATYAQQADIANQINTDREIEDADVACPPVVFGTVGGAAEVQNGYMRFPELRGQTIKWNQLVQNGNFADDDWSKNDATLTISDNTATLTATAQRGLMHRPTKQVQGHKYLLSAYVKLTTGTTDVCFCRGGSVLGGSTQNTTSLQLMTYIYNGASTTSNAYIGICDNRSSDWDAVQIKNFMLFDLTDIYGAGNEPSTVAEFVRDFPMPYYPYNAGTLLSSKSSSVDFIKRNQWDEETELGYIDISTGQNATSDWTLRSKNYDPCLPNTIYYINSGTHATFAILWYDGNKSYIGYNSSKNKTVTSPLNACFFRIYFDGTTYNHDICIYINWDTPGLPYVPYSKQHITLPNLELRSAGSAYDVLYQQGGGKRRIGVVDLGTIEWSTASVSGDDQTIHRFLSDNVIAKGTGGEGTTLGNGICSHYDLVTNEQSYNKALGIAITQSGRLSVYDPSKNTITSSEFKTAMSGVTLYYELATETDITLEENPGWTEYADIENFGTVKTNQDPAQDIPVPQAYFVRYVVNLVEFLDSLFVHCGGDVSKLALVE